MKRLLFVTVVGGTSSGCAVLSNLRGGNVGGAVDASRDFAHDNAAAAARATMQAKLRQRQVLRALKTKPVGFVEDARWRRGLIQQLKDRLLHRQRRETIRPTASTRR